MYLKIALPNDTMCRIKLPNSFAELKDAVKQKYSQANSEEFDLVYNGNDDEVLVTNQEDFDNFVAFINSKGKVDSVKLFYRKRSSKDLIVNLNDTVELEAAFKAMPDFNGGVNSKEPLADQNRNPNALLSFQGPQYDFSNFDHVQMVDSHSFSGAFPNKIQYGPQVHHYAEGPHKIDEIPLAESTFFNSEALKVHSQQQNQSVSFTPEQLSYIALLLSQKSDEIEQRLEKELERRLHEAAEASRRQCTQELTLLFEKKLADMELRLSEQFANQRGSGHEHQQPHNRGSGVSNNIEEQYSEDVVLKGKLLQSVFQLNLKDCLEFAKRCDPSATQEQIVSLYMENNND